MSTSPVSDLFSRVDVSFDSGGVPCAAWLYRPASATTHTPIIVMAHGFGGVRTMRLDSYAQQFAEYGYAVLLFDYRHFGASGGEPRQLLDLGQERADWRRAIAYARTLKDLDTSRVVAWGTSLSGGHVIDLAARDQKLSAIIAQVPHVSGFAAARATGVVQSLRLGVAAFRDYVRVARGSSPFYIKAIGPSRSLSVMASDNADAGHRKMQAESLTAPGYPETVAARISLHMTNYSPGRKAKKVRCPALVQIALRDQVTPPGAAMAAAARMSLSRVKAYDCGHFDPYVEPNFSPVLKDQLEFLEQVVPI